MKRTFTMEKETKNTVRYAENKREGDIIAVGTIYVKKEALPTPPPREMRVTLEFS